NIVANLGGEHRIDICYMAECGARPAELLARHILPGGHDLVHFFWRDDLRGLIHPEHIHAAAAQSGQSVDSVLDALCAPAITTSIYDHLHLSAAALADRAGTLHFAH